MHKPSLKLSFCIFPLLLSCCYPSSTKLTQKLIGRWRGEYTIFKLTYHRLDEVPRTPDSIISITLLFRKNNTGEITYSDKMPRNITYSVVNDSIITIKRNKFLSQYTIKIEDGELRLHAYPAQYLPESIEIIESIPFKKYDE